MRVVIDNNVLISAALLKHSVPFKTFEKAVKTHVLLSSHRVLEEFLNTIFKPKFDRYFKDDLAKKGFVISFISTSTDINVKHHITLCRDPKDNMYLELALSGKAACIVTGDKDLLVLDPFRNIRIITPKEFLDQF
ncbi:MAG: putative toxin-antitoxin system toxin component, PIN family [Prolixibacteraceae bacterium]|nr:putative toxin-antitoxin system toxin component, PIN family [Prolixibacteraceae bacterium]